MKCQNEMSKNKRIFRVERVRDCRDSWIFICVFSTKLRYYLRRNGAIINYCTSFSKHFSFINLNIEFRIHASLNQIGYYTNMDNH